MKIDDATLHVIQNNNRKSNFQHDLSEMMSCFVFITFFKQSHEICIFVVGIKVNL